MAVSNLEILKQASNILSSGNCPATHATYGDVNLVGLRTSSDITEHLELYIKCKDGRHYWVDKTQLKFPL